mgnify:CR=1 FL=1
MGKYLITTFGCQANLADSEKTTEIMENLGYARASNMKDLIFARNPVLIFNTCSVRQKAEDRIFGLNKKLWGLRIKNPKLKTVLTGCMMHYSEKKLKKRLPYFDYFIDIKNIKKLAQILTKGSPWRAKDYPCRPTSLIPVSHGCDNFCTYCIVPYARGREISRPIKDIVKDVKKTLKNGAKEIWLLGQNVNSYQKELDFAGLLRVINATPGDFWIRFTSPHPKDFSDDLIKAMAECEKFAHYINLPVQSGNNQILKKMGRPYTVSHYKKLVKKLREKMPDIAISTDVIVGFPGETKKQFEDTIKLFKEVKFDMAFISEYSPRPKTAAAKFFKDNISSTEKTAHKEELNEILKRTALENNKKLLGKTVKVLNNRTAGNKLVEIKNVQHSMLNKNEFVDVKIIKATSWKLSGKLKNI